jgi:hypothetical protein
VLRFFDVFNFLRKTSLYLLAVPALIFFMGAASNQVVLIANNDTFPVLVNDLKLKAMTAPEAPADFNFFVPAPVLKMDGVVMLDDTHCNMTSKTHLNALADIFDMKDAIYSIGDFMLMLGSWLWSFAPPLFVFDVVRKLRERQSEY